METNELLLAGIESDLAIDAPYVKGQTQPVKNCWHFCTDGNAIDLFFEDEEDYVSGMNRIMAVKEKYDVIILAFVLMGTHVHFLLYGPFERCNMFMHEYLRRTSSYMSTKYGYKNKMKYIPINHQAVTDDLYLKTVICYIVKNPPVGGINYNCFDYPWSSGSLYFRERGNWTSPFWLDCEMSDTSKMTIRDKRNLFKTRQCSFGTVLLIGNMVFPGEYVSYHLVEKIFKTHKAYNYFLCMSREENVESRGGTISCLTLPLHEMRENRNTLSLEMFGIKQISVLDTSQRIMLAKALKRKFNSSTKQIAKLCGLKYEEVSNLL